MSAEVSAYGFNFIHYDGFEFSLFQIQLFPNACYFLFIFTGLIQRDRDFFIIHFFIFMDGNSGLTCS